MSNENNEKLTLADVDGLILADDFVITKTAKVRANNKKELDSNGDPKTDGDGKPIFINPQHEFKIRVIFSGKTINNLVDYAASPKVITWQNENRPKGNTWLKTNANKTFDLIVSEMNEKGSKDPLDDQMVTEIEAGRMTIEQFEAKIEALKKAREVK